MDIQYLKENNLLEAHKQFAKLAEAYYPTEESLQEDDEPDAQQDPNAAPPGGDPNAMGGDPNGGGMPPQDPNMMGADPNGGMPPADPNAMGGGDPNAMPPQDPNAMGDDPNAMGDPNAAAPDPSMVDGPIPEDQEQEDDGNTIDIDGLTKAQERLDIKTNHVGLDLGKVDNKINNLVDTLDQLMSRINQQNDEIEEFKQEFERRNPTQTEKLNLRSLDSYPFSEKPTDYWNKKAKDSNYSAYADNDEPTTQEFKITNDDIDNPDEDIANSFYKPSEDDIQTLDKIFKL